MQHARTVGNRIVQVSCPCRSGTDLPLVPKLPQPELQSLTYSMQAAHIWYKRLSEVAVISSVRMLTAVLPISPTLLYDGHITLSRVYHDRLTAAIPVQTFARVCLSILCFQHRAVDRTRETLPYLSRTTAVEAAQAVL